MNRRGQMTTFQERLEINERAQAGQFRSFLPARMGSGDA
jgi:hypothetical protein